MRGPAISLIALTWFSLGTAGLPLINYYPFSGLDVARFALFMAPFMALMGGYLLPEVLGAMRAPSNRNCPCPRGWRLEWSCWGRDFCWSSQL